MPKSRNYARIAITIPEEDLATADRLALKLDRSRSWLVAEAVRRYGTALEAENLHPSVGAARPASAERGLGASRLAQLTRDFMLTPEERVRAAEETLRLSQSARKRRTHTITGFDTYEDFLDWKRKPDAQR